MPTMFYLNNIGTHHYGLQNSATWIYSDSTTYDNFTSKTIDSIVTNDSEEWKKFANIFKDVTVDKKVINLPSYPPCDCFINRDYSVTIRFALAGYKKEEVSVEISKTNQLIIKTEPLKEIEGPVYLHRKISHKKVDISLQLDTNYDLSKAEVSFNDGLLTIVIPRSVDATITKLM